MRAVLFEGERSLPFAGGPEAYQTLQVEVLDGDRRGELVTADAGQLVSGRTMRFAAGDRVVLNIVPRPGPEEWVVVDAVRRPALYWLAGIFAVMVAVVGGWRGLASILGLAVSFGVLVVYILPRLVAGADPILTTVSGSLIILVATLYLAHGFSRKTSIAIVSTAIALVVTGLLGSYFVDFARLSGFSEEALYLRMALPGLELNLQGLLLASIIIGGLGVLDDITVSQSAVVFALRDANPGLPWRDLYRRAMAVGRDHIASLVNTLVLAYAGAALPLLLLFSTYQVPFAEALNREIMAVEVVRTLVGSLGLVTAVPITTLLAAQVAVRTRPGESGSTGAAGHHGHHH